jgi:hypothetical protein
LLKKVCYILKHLRLASQCVVESQCIDECNVIAAIWTEEAKDATLKAATKAGFGSRPIDEVYTIAEPEAAATVKLKRYSGPNTLNSVNVSPFGREYKSVTKLNLVSPTSTS